MKNPIFVLLFLYCFSFSGQDDLHPRINTQINLEEVGKCIVPVISGDKFGSGIYIKRDIIVSTYHLKSDKPFDILGETPLTLKEDPKLDLILFRVPKQKYKIKISRRYESGQECWIVGYGLGIKGVVHGYIYGQKGVALLIDAKVISGMSGGGVFNLKGELLGMVSGGMKTIDFLLVALTSEAIEKEL